jgi:antitoxin component YwqK of YwqJK toxin-antitoxin module
MKNLKYIIILFSLHCFSQAKVDSDDVYRSNGLTLLKDNNQPFTGEVEYRRNNGHLMLFKEFDNGIKTKATTFYNVELVIVSEEEYYSNQILKKRFKYSLDQKRRCEKYYEDSGNVKLEEDFLEGKLIYHCEYLNNKKNGRAYGFDKKGKAAECLYENGKLIK